MVKKQELQEVESFAELFAKQIELDDKIEGKVVKGTVISIDKDMINIDVGYKAEGRINVREFVGKDKSASPKVGDIVEVYLERVENKNGEAILSREKARREESWETLEKASEIKEKVTGTIFGRVKGGFSVDLDGAIAFLPGSQVDVRPTRDSHHLVGSSQLFHILKMDRRRGNIVVSRRSVLEESRAEAKAELVSTMEEGQILEGIIKNITDYGAFVDLGEVDGLLHVTDISWKRISHPSEALSIGQKVKVQVIKFNPETQRISLGMKQLEEDPWEVAQSKYKVKDKFSGRVTNITDYGAFVDLGGLDGLLHITDISWSRVTNPAEMLSLGDEIDVKVLSFDKEKLRVSLGLKQIQNDPWENVESNYAVGGVYEASVSNITDYGCFAQLEEGIEGLIHLSELDWTSKNIHPSKVVEMEQKIKVMILEIDHEKRRISLGLKQTKANPWTEFSNKYALGDKVEGQIKSITDFGIFVGLEGDIDGLIHLSDISDAEDPKDALDEFKKGDKLNCLVFAVDADRERISLRLSE